MLLYIHAISKLLFIFHAIVELNVFFNSDNISKSIFQSAKALLSLMTQTLTVQIVYARENCVYWSTCVHYEKVC